MRDGNGVKSGDFSNFRQLEPIIRQNSPVWLENSIAVTQHGGQGERQKSNQKSSRHVVWHVLHGYFINRGPDSVEILDGSVSDFRVIARRETSLRAGKWARIASQSAVIFFFFHSFLKRIIDAHTTEL